MDVISLRIDNQERMVNNLNDNEISPTNYMLAFLKQRAWGLPERTTTIPNIIPEVDPETEAVSPYDSCLRLVTKMQYQRVSSISPIRMRRIMQ